MDPSEKIKLYNFSSQKLPPAQISLLCLGTKFVPATRVSHEERKVDILKFSRKLLLKANFHGSDYSDPSLIKPASTFIPKVVKSQTLKGIVEDLEIFANEIPESVAFSSKDNLTPEQRLALGDFKKQKNILYFKADKGSSVVLLDPLFYKYKILEVLGNGKYEKLPRNIDYFVILKLRQLVKKYDFLTKNEVRAITNFDYVTTNLYGLAKIHKSKIIKDALINATGNYLHLPYPVDLTFRLIFGGPKSPTSGLADLLNVLLKPFVDKVNSRVRDVFDFINKIPKFKTEDLPFIELISVDVKSMYENLEQNLGLPAMRYFLNRYPKLIPSRFSAEFILESMKFVLENNTGYFNGDSYRQLTGTATGIKPAPPYADLAMGTWKLTFFINYIQS